MDRRTALTGRRSALLLLALVLASCAPVPPQLAPPPTGTAPSGSALPEAAAARLVAPPAQGIAVTAHPLATQAALQMLAAGGSAVDATVAAQMVLGLVEPQSSGPGGGSLMMVWQHDGRRLTSYDGLSSAPALTTASLRTDVDGRQLPADAVSRGGRSVGVPGTLAVMELAHRRHGRLPWARLFEPAIRLAETGYPLAPYVHAILARDPGARQHPEFRADWFDASGRVHPVGTLLRNPDYARALRQIADGGVQAYWRGGGAKRVAEAARRGEHASLMTADDVAGYQPREREPLCAPVRVWRICMVGPPSFGGVAVLQMLQLLDARLGAAITPASLDDPAFWHLYVEAGRLAQADRRFWVGDPDLAAVPAAELVAPAYVRQRARLIDATQALPRIGHGDPAAAPQAVGQAPDDDSRVAADTSQLVVADAQGNVVSTTTTINLNFGARLRVDGYVLNNALTNFGPAPLRGQTIANQMAPGKRPVTSMSPLVVLDQQGQVLLAGGSAGGGQIVDYIAQNLVEMLWLERSPAQALADGHVSTALAPTVQLEAGTPRAALADALRARGHAVTVEPLLSGAGFIRRRGDRWEGAADPRRDGSAASP